MSTSALRTRSHAIGSRGPFDGDLPVGVVLRDLVPHADNRGIFTELHRDEWQSGPRPVQWNAVRSKANVLRGVHVHRRHADELVVLDGVMLLALHDLRPDSATRGLGLMVELRGDTPRSAEIPPGVAHGFFFPAPAIYIYAVSEYFDATDELGCRFDSPELGLKWPTTAPVLSPRDAGAPGYAEMVAGFVAKDTHRTAPSAR